MIKAYLSCPDSRVVVHRNPNCAAAQETRERRQRHVLLNADTLSQELARFAGGKHRFEAAGELADLWLILDFQDPEFEEALVAHVRRLAGRHCAPLAGAGLQVHC